MIIGIPFNPISPTLSARLQARVAELGVPHRVLHLPSLRATADGVTDHRGPVVVTHLAPGTTYGEPDAEVALAQLEAAGVRALNPVAACAIADDKILTCTALGAAGLRQPRWTAVHRDDLANLRQLGFPLVLKRPIGALGMWNRFIATEAAVAPAVTELLSEGGNKLLAQAAVTEAFGRSLRVVVLQDRVLASTELVAEPGEWRSNGALGSIGHTAEISAQEQRLAIAGLAAVGLGYGGVDILRASDGPVLIEVNAGSSFDGAERRTRVDIAGALLAAVAAL
jgi:ribosomal protein S6--L-glutamate ligase